MPRSRLSLGLLATLSALPTATDHLEELVVRETHDTRTIDVTGQLLISPDVAQLLKRAPGANVNSNGPLTGIPQYRGQRKPRFQPAREHGGRQRHLGGRAGRFRGIARL